jgi:glutamate carboxypeptidase
MKITDLSEWTQKQQVDIAAAIKQLVEINTYTANTQGVDRAMAVLEGMATGMGFECEHVNDRHLLVRSGNGNGKRIMLITHMDTVHPPDSSFRDYQPFGEGFIKGPGTGDIKGGTVLGLWAMKAVEELLPDENYDLRMIVSADEETGSPTIKDWYGDRDRHGADYAIGLEPGFPQGELSPTVDLGVVYQRRGYAAITFNVVGKASHSGSPHLGLNAIDALAHKIVKITALNDWENGKSVNVGLVHGGTAPNTVPESVEATVSFRYETLADGLELRKQIEAIILEPVTQNEELGLSDSAVYHIDTFIPPMERTSDSKKLVDIVLDEAKALALPVVPIARGGGSDANHVSGSGTPTICGMGAPAQGIHTENEMIYFPTLLARVGLLARSCYRIITE